MVFETLKKEEKKFETNDPDIEDYDEFLLGSDMEPGMTFKGQPYLGEPYEYTFTSDYTSKEETNRRCQLWIMNHQNREVLKAQLKLKTLDDEAKFWEGSLGFDLIDSIDRIHNPGEGNHNIVTISLQELREYLNGLDVVEIRVIEHTSKIKGEDTSWNTLRITRIGE
jgi:hypothetical protein